jgi:hypothetical protein
MNTPPPIPSSQKKASAYSRSRLFRWGLWMLAGAVGLMVWHGIKDSMISKKETLFTLSGVVLEERSWEAGGNTSIRLRTGGSARVQDQPTQKSYLKVRSDEGVVKEFEQDQWYPTPKAGWVNQPIRLQYDSLDNIYEIEVAGEMIRSTDTTQKYRKIDNKKNQSLMVFLIVFGTPMVLVGWLLSLRKPKAR